MGDSAVTGSKTVVVSETVSERYLTFSPLKTSHGGEYWCKATISRINIYNWNVRITYMNVKSK